MHRNWCREFLHSYSQKHNNCEFILTSNSNTLHMMGQPEYPGKIQQHYIIHTLMAKSFQVDLNYVTA